MSEDSDVCLKQFSDKSRKMALDMKTSANSPCNMYVDLLSCASLRIAEEDWNSLVNSDIKLGVQVGLLLLKNNKELEAVLAATQERYEEQKERADQFEMQLKTFVNLEKQIEDLTLKYALLIDDCECYKNKNTSLWKRVEQLERDCELYLEQICSLRREEGADEEPNTVLDKDIFSNRFFKSAGYIDSSRSEGCKLPTDSVRNENYGFKQRKIELENDIEALDATEPVSLKNSFVPSYCKINEQHTNVLTNNNPTVRHYHEIFAEMFAKIQSTKRELSYET